MCFADRTIQVRNVSTRMDVPSFVTLPKFLWLGMRLSQTQVMPAHHGCVYAHIAGASNSINQLKIHSTNSRLPRSLNRADNNPCTNYTVKCTAVPCESAVWLQVSSLASPEPLGQIPRLQWAGGRGRGRKPGVRLGQRWDHSHLGLQPGSWGRSVEEPRDEW